MQGPDQHINGGAESGEPTADPAAPRPDAEKDLHVVGHPDPLIVGATADVIGNFGHNLSKSLHPDIRPSRSAADDGAYPADD